MFWEERALLKGFQIDRNNKWAEQKLRTILAYSYLKSGRYELCESNVTILLESFGETAERAELYITQAECFLGLRETPKAAVDLMKAEKVHPTADGLSKIARLKTLKKDIESIATVNLYNLFRVHRNAAVSQIRHSFERMSKLYDKLSKALTEAANRVNNTSVAFDKLILSLISASVLWLMVLQIVHQAYVECRQELGAKFEAVQL